VIGTIDFMAPEVLCVPRRSQFDSDEACRAALAAYPGFGLCADVWALGITVYEALCGRRPWPSLDKVRCVRCAGVGCVCARAGRAAQDSAGAGRGGRGAWLM
jgi:serine/threonine protein kinase